MFWARICPFPIHSQIGSPKPIQIYYCFCFRFFNVFRFERITIPIHCSFAVPIIPPRWWALTKLFFLLPPLICNPSSRFRYFNSFLRFNFLHFSSFSAFTCHALLFSFSDHWKFNSIYHGVSHCRSLPFSSSPFPLCSFSDSSFSAQLLQI